MKYRARFQLIAAEHGVIDLPDTAIGVTVGPQPDAYAAMLIVCWMEPI